MSIPLPNKTSISGSTIPINNATRKAVVNPSEFAPGIWSFEVNRAQQLDWVPLSATCRDDNYFAKNEGYQDIKNSMYNQPNPGNPIYGHVKRFINPLDNEQTNAKMAGYQLQKSTRVANNMSPAYSMRFPSYKYPSNVPPSIWANVYTGSTRETPMAGMR